LKSPSKYSLQGLKSVSVYVAQVSSKGQLGRNVGSHFVILSNDEQPIYIDSKVNAHHFDFCVS